MRRNRQKISRIRDTKPRSVVYIDQEKAEPVTIAVVDYSETEQTTVSNIAGDEAARDRCILTAT